MNIKEINIKSIITKSNLPDADFVINPYIGCQHGCKYCYADFIKRFTGHSNEDWGSFVDVKINAADKIKLKTINKNSTILIGSVTDPYQPIEKKYKITRQCLTKLLVYQPKIEILTKSKLILRDVDILKQFKNLKVGVSIGIQDNEFSKELEPLSSSPNERIEVLKILNKENINTYLFISPIFPGITDYKRLIKMANKYVNKILFENINIRNNNRKRIIDFLRMHKPELITFYKDLQNNKTYWDSIKNDIQSIAENYSIPFKIYFHHGKEK